MFERALAVAVDSSIGATTTVAGGGCNSAGDAANGRGRCTTTSPPMKKA
jgi:hypothetical protein